MINGAYMAFNDSMPYVYKLYTNTGSVKQTCYRQDGTVENKLQYHQDGTATSRLRYRQWVKPIRTSNPG